MSNFKSTMLWKTAFEGSEATIHSDAANRLVAAFEKTRDNAKVIVSEIAVDLPGYTVHDIEHLDALWEVGSQITGGSFKLNPVEGLILGCAFLFHDAAMTLAAYPGGFEDIKATREWRRIVGRLSAAYEEPVDEKSAIEIFLREQHAKQAEHLPMLSWESDGGYRFLIDDADIREKYGDFIGVVSASHWWDHAKIEEQLAEKVIPAPSPFPSSWSIDLFKIACVLRTADAAQIDDRRAPGLLRALRRNRLSDISTEHWKFQNRLTQAQNRGDTLYFASFKPFARDEARAWWLLHDTLKMIDVELRKTDDLLTRKRGEEHRFAARKVANIESPKTLQACFLTNGWQPVDTAFSIADIPRLVENLGGNQLYGHDNFVAVREAVQNAMDAVRLRQLIDPSMSSPLVEVELQYTDQHAVLIVKDNGVGMTETEIVDHLLSFGASGWLADSSIGEYNDVFPTKSSVSGRYGIGFFSIFMVSSQVHVKSRRFDASTDETVRCQSFWNQLQFELSEYLAHLVIDVRRRDCGIASAAG